MSLESDRASEIPEAGAGVRSGLAAASVADFVCRTASWIVIGLGAASLVSRALPIFQITPWLAPTTGVKVSTALALLLLGSTLLLRGMKEAGRLVRRAGDAFSLCVVVLGLAALIDYTGISRFQLDGWLSRNLFGVMPTPGLVPVNASIDLLLLGAALLLLDARTRRGTWPTEWLVYLAAPISIEALLSHVYGVSGKESLAGTPYLSTFSAIGFLLSGLGILASRPDRGNAAILWRDTPGGFAARLLIPTAAGVLAALGGLWLAGERAGLYGTEVGLTLLIGASISAIAILVSAGSALLDRLDFRRRAAEDERQLAQQSLLEGDARKSAILESALDCIIAADEKGRITEFNPAAERTFGYRRQDVLGRELAETIVPPWLRDAHRRGMARYLETGKGNVVGQRMELPAMRADGSVFPAELAITAFPFEGRRAFTASLRDITERKRAEEVVQREAGLMKLLHAAAVAANESDSLEEAAQAVLNAICEHTGWPVAHAYMHIEDPGGDAAPTNVWHLSDPERTDAFRRATEETRFTLGSGLVGRALCTTTPQWVNHPVDHLDPSRREAAQELGFQTWIGAPILVGRDVTAVLEFFATEDLPCDPALLEVLGHVGTQLGRVVERIRSAKIQAKDTAELERSNRELQEFANIASHDLQEPLRKVTSFGERLAARAESALDEENRDYLQRMLRSAERMQGLIDSLLALSRVTTRGQPFTPTDLGAVASEVVEDLEVRIGDSNGRVEIGTLPTVDADPLQMRELFQNLIANGLKFHKSGSTPVIELDSRPAPDGSWEIAVSDNGIGFDEKYLDRIFRPFQRLHARSEYEGSGIGLAVCRKIVQRHGGDITARSAPGKGSTFLVRLPSRSRRRGGTA
jgi:two-component system sensor kinase FixL